MPCDSRVDTVKFAVLLCLVCSLLVSVVVGLCPSREANVDALSGATVTTDTSL